ncbi:LIN37 [Popillia japonica]|uniref:LIN37 n=1 Tax=Popillia japonica TaxID=7064 RepID=A0AAW1KGL7_POPJA
MTKKRKLSASGSSPFKVEVKEENIMGDEYLVAKGRLQGVLRQLTEQSDTDADSSDDSGSYRNRKYGERRRKSDNTPTAFHHTYVMKLFDRSVDLARFEEDTPLYPICRAWMANQPRNPQLIVKRRNSTPEPENSYWNINNNNAEVTRLPPPSQPFVSRIPSPTPEQRLQDKDAINLNYDESTPVAKDVLIRNHLQRWVNIKKKWIATAVKNESRYKMAKQILEAIYNKAQETE